MASTPAKKKTTTKAKATAPTKKTSKAKAPRRAAPSHDAIAKRAYELSLAEAGGDDVSHWLQAEHELSS